MANERIARRIHIFMDGFGWSSQRDAEHGRMESVRDAKNLPPVSRDVLITFFNATDTDDLDLLRDRIQELRTDAQWHGGD